MFPEHSRADRRDVLTLLQGLRLSDGTTASERIRLGSTPPSVTATTRREQGNGAECKHTTVSGQRPSLLRTQCTKLMVSPASWKSDAQAGEFFSGMAQHAIHCDEIGSVSAQPALLRPSGTTFTTDVPNVARPTNSKLTVQADTCSSPQMETHGNDGCGNVLAAFAMKLSGQPVTDSATLQSSPKTTTLSSSTKGSEQLNPKVLELFQSHGFPTTVTSVAEIARVRKTKAVTTATGAAAAASLCYASPLPIGHVKVSSTLKGASISRGAMEANRFISDALGGVPVDNCGAERLFIRTLPTLSDDGRYIIVGDVHGCVGQLEALVEKVKYVKGRDCLIVIGDYVNKGPDSIGVVRTCQRLEALGVLGNHDDTLIKCCVARRQKGSFSADELRDPVKKLAQEFPEDCEAYLRSLPHILRLPQYNIILVHAGLNVQNTLEQQSVTEVMNVRRLCKDSSSRAANGGGEQYKAIYRGKEGAPWASYWNGPELVIFGHDALVGFQVHPHAIGIDTGCVYGDALTCVVFSKACPQGEFFSVPGLPKNTNELNGLPSPTSSIYELPQKVLERQIIRPNTRSTPSAMSPGSQSAFLSAPLGYVFSPTPSGPESRSASMLSPSGKLDEALSSTATSAEVKPHTAASDVSDVGTGAVHKATLLSLANAHELRALSVVLALPSYDLFVEDMLKEGEHNAAIQKTFWIPFVRHVLEAVRVAALTATLLDSCMEEVLHLALTVCSEIPAVGESAQTYIKALLKESRSKWSRATVKHLQLLST